MRLEQLQYFVQIVESRSFNKASQQLNITQPALSNAVSSLEDELGLQLLQRSRRGCTPTLWGTRVYEDCKAVLNELSEKVAAWKALASDSVECGQVPIVAIPSASTYLLDVLIPMLKAEIPGIEIVQHGATLYELYDFLRAGSAHIALAAFTNKEAENLLEKYRQAGFSASPLREDEYRVFISSENILARKEALSLEDCANLHFATYASQYNKRRSLFQEIAGILKIKKYSFVNSRESIMRMIAQNKAAGCFLHDMAKFDWFIMNGQIRAMTVRGIRLLPSRHYLLSLDNAALCPAEKVVANFIRDNYNRGFETKPQSRLDADTVQRG